LFLILAVRRKYEDNALILSISIGGRGVICHNICHKNVSHAHKCPRCNESQHVVWSPPPPHVHARLSLAREPASTELGSGERDACPSIRVCFCFDALSCVVASRGIHTYIFLLYCPRSLAVTGSGAFYLYHRHREPSRDILGARYSQDHPLLLGAPLRRCMTEFPFDSCGDWYTGTN
jgi:hypothetical protein